MHPRHIVVLGGGFSGAAVVIHLLRQAPTHTLVTLVDPAERCGPGLAFGACEPMHLLNVPAGRMSALPDEPDNFLRWLEALRHSPDRGTLVPRNLTADSFVSRRLFGEYVTELLATTRAQSPVPYRHIMATATNVERDGDRITVQVSSGETLSADQLVLALGNISPTSDHPACAALTNHPGYIHDIWARKPWHTPARADEILFIGTGLTMVDAVLAFARHGHRGSMIGLSRRGLLPSIHHLGTTHPAFLAPATEQLDLRTTVARVRAEIRRAAARGTPWQAVIDSLRPVTPTLWSRFSPVDQQRFLRHVKSYWETHRHRLAPELALEVAKLRETGRFELTAGALLRATPLEHGFEITLQPRRSTAPVVRRVGRIVNCTGPAGRLDRHASPLLRSLFDQGLIASDPLGLGLAADPTGFVYAADGSVSRSIATLGSLVRGLRWETTAVPEVRVQAATLAAALVAR